jgi:hypothetical protein
MTNLVTMPLLPVSTLNPLSRFFGTHRTASWNRHITGESTFTEAGIASWIEWSSKNGIQFEIAKRMPDPEDCGCSKSQIENLQQFPPTVQRWLLPLAAFHKYGRDSGVAMVDADTIVSPGAPSIFCDRHESDLNLTRDREWNDWKTTSCKAFAPLFPDVDFDQSLYFNAGVMVLNSPVLASEFIKFTLARSSEFLSVMDGTVGTDQTPLNFLFQRLKKSGTLSASFLGPKWNARVDLALAAREPNQDKWKSLARSVVSENFISHFIMTKELMPSVWETIKKELHPQDTLPRAP